MAEYKGTLIVKTATKFRVFLPCKETNHAVGIDTICQKCSSSYMNEKRYDPETQELVLTCGCGNTFRTWTFERLREEWNG